MTWRKFDFKHLAETLTPTERKQQRFSLKSDPTIRLKPYLDFSAGEPYFLYLQAGDKYR